MTDVQINTYNAVEQAVPLPFSAAPSEGERELSSRYARSPRAATEITYEFTKDKGLLHQYYVLREQMFVNVWGLTHFSGEEDAIDKRSHILVARKGNQVVGGLRLTVKTPRLKAGLPVEGEDFNLSKELPSLSLENLKYGEISRLVQLPEYTNTDCMVELCKNLRRKSVALGLQYVFCIAPKALCKRYKMICRVINLSVVSLDEVIIPDREGYEGISMHLMYFDLTDDLAQVDSPTSDELAVV
jgi:hypothetical protein